MLRSKNLIIPLLLLLLLASCATKPTPPPEEPVVVPAPVEPVTPPPETPAAPAFDRAELDPLLAETLALRKKAFDLGLADLLSADYKVADAAYLAGKTAYDAKDGPSAKASLENSRGLFNDLIARGLVQLSGKGKANAEDARAAAVKVGADKGSEGRFAAAEAAYTEGQTLAAAGKHEEAIAAYSRASSLYQLAGKRTSATELRARIEKNGYASWDTGNHRLAENKYAEEASLFGAGSKDPKNVAAGLDAIDEAILRYKLVVEKGREGIAGASKKKSDDNRALSDTIKASVAVKAEYAQALVIYQEGMKALAEKDYETATAKFAQAAAYFDNAYALAARKRAKAEEAMQAAATAADESQRKAVEAEPLVVAPAGVNP